MNEKFTRDMYLVILKTIFLFTQFRIEIDRIGGVMVIVLPSGIVDRGFETPVWSNIGGVMISVLPSSMVDRGFETPVCQTSVV
jgi:hypothetical protein